VKKLIVLFACICSHVLAQSGKPAERFISAFELRPNDLELTRPAQPDQYFDKIGRRAGLMGYESGSFELWVWPWKPLRNFELQCLVGTSTQPILAKDIVRTISATPEATTLTYTNEAFTVNEHILIPRDEPGAILLLEVHTTTPLAIIPGFIPVMQPMWPAGIGGQFSYWDDDANAYVISEGQWRAIFLCGSPAGKQMAAPPAHMFADNPLQFRIDVKPGESDGRFIPIVLAGGLPDSSSGKMKFDSVKATYRKLWKNAGEYYRENRDYYEGLRNSTMQVVTPDKEINLAYEWGKVALDNLMVVNPRLGYGMVAGFGLSGAGARPGFAWFFGGDAFINSLAMNSYGDVARVRDALAFTQKWQRRENFPIRKKNPADPPRDVGKMAHELSQSDGICDWWNDYHYGYNHADTTPWYIVAMADYVRTSGDLEFLKKSWTSVKQAYAWCLSKDSDNDGLMDLKGAGLGALEFGKLVGIYADVYTCGVWVQAIKETKYMADLVGDSDAARQADAQFRRAQPQLEKKFWMEKEGFYSYGATDKGEQVHEKTPWAGVAMMYGLLDEARTSKSIETFNRADLCTDWGVRSLSNRSALFEPTNYNYGAVWPFISAFFNTAQFEHHSGAAGYQILRSVIRHVFDHALGEVPEVFSGELNEKLGEGYHHQGFSTTGYMLPMIKGMLGLEVDGVKKEITFRPRLSAEWDSIAVKRIAVGENTFDLDLVRHDRGDDAIYDLRIHAGHGSSCLLEFVPELPSGNVFKSYDDGSGVQTSRPENLLGARVKDGARIEYVFGRAPSFSASPSVAQQGSVNKGLRILNEWEEGGRIHLSLEGLANQTYRLAVHDAGRIVSVKGGYVKDEALIVVFDKRAMQEFVRKEVVVTFK
jgi:glycogen debranching enzyme